MGHAMPVIGPRLVDLESWPKPAGKFHLGKRPAPAGQRGHAPGHCGALRRRAQGKEISKRRSTLASAFIERARHVEF
jgi:hypothetical protein